MNGYIIKDEESDPSGLKAASRSKHGGTGRSTEYRSGQFSGYELARSHKF